MSRRGPLFKYFGSKYRSSKHYPAPRYPLIIEPFAGGAGYALRYRENNVLLCDLDSELIALWQWLIQADPDEIAAMPVEGLITGQDIRTLGLSAGAAQLMRYWQRTGHVSAWTISNITTGESEWCTKHGKGQAGGNTGMWHRNTRDYLVQAVQEIRHWSAVCGSYETLPRIKATWFIDPPYQGVKYSSYKHGLKGIDYSALADWCRSLPGQVIVAEQEGATWLPFVYSHEVSGMRGKMRGVAGAKSREMIWTNGM
jgi:site-specific DNA-adenine methylase